MKKPSYVCEISVLYEDLSLEELTNILKLNSNRTRSEMTFGREEGEYGEFNDTYWLRFKDNCWLLNSKEEVLETAQILLNGLDENITGEIEA